MPDNLGAEGDLTIPPLLAQRLQRGDAHRAAEVAHHVEQSRRGTGVLRLDSGGCAAHRVLIEPSFDDPCMALCIIDRALRRALQMESYPKFHNEVGVRIVRIGCREFKCIGDKPPQDHPHIYLNMGDASEIGCPYCSTLFRFDPSLGAHEADPAGCAYGEMD